jgi:HEPN domain-containing protein
MNEPLKPQKLVQKWVELALDDFGAAEDLFPRGRWRQVCFHCQQSAEKWIKALLTHRQMPIERTHDLERLLVPLTDALELGLLRHEILDLSEYAVDARYPSGDDEDLNELDAKRALNSVSELQRILQPLLKR